MQLLLLTAVAATVRASQQLFSVNDDIFAYPQYEVVFSDSYVSARDAVLLTGRLESTELQSNSGPIEGGNSVHETLVLHNQEYLCTIPVVERPKRDPSLEAAARKEEQNELARATSHGWELISHLDGQCLYYVSGWWSYSLCNNREVTQFHPMTPLSGIPSNPPRRDLSIEDYMLGRAESKQSGDIRSKGDAKYLVQRFGQGSPCDLTGKPRDIEVQYHCNTFPHDRIASIKEITTCSYQMIVYTPRLCNDAAFLPPKEDEPNAIACRMIISDDELAYWHNRKGAEAVAALEPHGHASHIIDVGGIVVGGNKWGLAAPETKGLVDQVTVEVIARGYADSLVELLPPEELVRLDLDVDDINQACNDMMEAAGGKNWRLELVESASDRHVRGMVDSDEEAVWEVDETGSEETYEEEL